MAPTRFDPEELLKRVETALRAAREVYASFDGGEITEMTKGYGDPLTEVDTALDSVLKEILLADGDGWLSEETADTSTRLDRDIVWIVDPLDGTREFIDGLPEFCTSIAAVVDGVPVVGGTINPAANLEVIGGLGIGLTCNGVPVERSRSPVGNVSRVLASRTEVGQGRWEMVEAAGIDVEPMGSVAYKMARVAAGLDWATWTPVPKHEWDVAGGAALLKAAGGTAVGLNGRELTFNRANPLFDGAIAVPPGFEVHLDTVLDLARQQADL
ncbi:MAG: inositol monophosphatase family protein [Actinomycetota bacterium]